MKQGQNTKGFMLYRSKERAKLYGEVFTPPEIVDMMLDMVKEDIENIYKTVLEPSCGNGNFVVAIVERRMKAAKNDREKLIGLSNVYGIDIMEDNIMETRERTMKVVEQYISSPKAIKVAQHIINTNIIHGDFLLMQYVKTKEDILIYRYEIPEDFENFTYITVKLCEIQKNYVPKLF